MENCEMWDLTKMPNLFLKKAFAVVLSSGLPVTLAP
jgi:hypothetical protein